MRGCPTSTSTLTRMKPFLDSFFRCSFQKRLAFNPPIFGSTTPSCNYVCYIHSRLQNANKEVMTRHIRIMGFKTRHLWYRISLFYPISFRFQSSLFFFFFFVGDSSKDATPSKLKQTNGPSFATLPFSRNSSFPETIIDQLGPI